MENAEESSVMAFTPSMTTADAKCERGVFVHYELTIRFYVNIIFVPIFVIFGIIGNVLSFVITRSGKVNFGFPSTKVFIRALALADVGYLLGAVLFQILRSVQFDTPWLKIDVFPHVYRYVWPYMASVQTLETWLVVAIAVDRYVALSRPLKAVRLCTQTRASIAAGVILVLSCAFNIPHWLEFDTEKQLDPCSGRETVRIVSTPLFENKAYQIIYWSVLTMVLRFLVPLTLLTIVTVRLVATIRAASSTRAQLQYQPHPPPKFIGLAGLKHRVKVSTKAGEKDQVTKVLTSVVVVFILCESIEFIMHLLQTLRWTSPHYASWEIAEVQSSFNTIGNLTLVISASTNFILYCAFGQRFRQELRRMMCGACVGAGIGDDAVSRATSGLETESSHM